MSGWCQFSSVQARSKISIKIKGVNRPYLHVKPPCKAETLVPLMLQAHVLGGLLISCLFRSLGWRRWISFVQTLRNTLLSTLSHRWRSAYQPAYGPLWPLPLWLLGVPLHRGLPSGAGGLGEGGGVCLLRRVCALLRSLFSKVQRNRGGCWRHRLP